MRQCLLLDAPPVDFWYRRAKNVANWMVAVQQTRSTHPGLPARPYPLAIVSPLARTFSARHTSNDEWAKWAAKILNGQFNKNIFALHLGSMLHCITGRFRHESVGDVRQHQHSRDRRPLFARLFQTKYIPKLNSRMQINAVGWSRSKRLIIVFFFFFFWTFFIFFFW